MTKFKKILFAAATAMTTAFAANADNVMMHTPESFQVLSLSPNGKWACGVFVDGAGEVYAFRWNLDGGSIEMLDQQSSLAWDIANDGTVSGEFYDTQATDNGAGVTMPGFWRNNKWHHLEMPKGAIAGGMGAGISPDGHYMVGTLEINGLYSPYIWEEGKLHRTLQAPDHSVAYAVSPDGNGAAGFITTKNRTAAYWPATGDPVLFTDSPDYSYSPWNYARNFSPDGTKLLYWGGWEVASDNEIYLYSVYNIETGERYKVPSPNYESDLEFFDISNNCMLVGYDRGRGYIFDAAQEKGMYVDDYFKSRGVDMSKFDDFYSGTDYYVGQLPIFRVIAVSEDENVFAMQYYNKTGQVSSMVVKIDQDFSKALPAEINVKQLDGINAVALTWKRPVGVNTVRGYNIYRDGKKINGILPVSVPYYYDNNLQPGSYTYEVSAVMVSGAENRAEAITVEVGDITPQAPQALFTRQKGVNNAYVSWNAPLSNIAHKHYHSLDANLESFSIYQPMTIEAGVRFNKAEMACYKNHKITEVSFVPMQAQAAWTVNIYAVAADESLSLVASQPVTGKLDYKQLNTVRLSNPIDIPASDIIVAVEVTTKEGSMKTLGAELGSVTAGYSDLLRQKTDNAFFSTFDSSAASGMSITCMSWAIDLGLKADGAADNNVKAYNIYVNGEKTGETTNTYYVIPSLADGDYKLCVEADYDAAGASQMLDGTLTIAGVYPAITEVEVTTGEEGSTEVNASWQAPVDADITDFSYTKATKASNGITGLASNGYSLMAAVDFPSSMMRGFNGYKVKSFRFYPLADALFTFWLYEDNDVVCELEVDEYTLNQWNEIAVPDDVVINENATYRLVIDSFDPVPEVKVLAVDNKMPHTYVSDLYSTDNGENWNSFSTETSLNGNWMLGMTIAAPEADEIAVDGYDVVIDGKVCNNGRISETNYTHDMLSSDDKAHRLRVDVYYPARAEVVKGDVTVFRLPVSGIADGMVTSVKLHRGDNFLIADGDNVKSLTVVSTSGARVANAEGNRVDISSLAPGTYLVQIAIDNNVITRKINISR